MKKIVALMLTLVMSMAVLAGCGSDAGDKNTETKPADAGTTQTEETTGTQALKVIDVDLSSEEYAFGVDKDQPELLQQANDFIKEIQGNGEFDRICNNYFGDGTPVPVESAEQDDSKDQLVVATNAGFEPFEYTKGDKYLGIDMEIAKMLADKLGKELVIANMDFDAVCLSVGQHKCDIAMAGLTIKESRKKYVTFTDSYYNASQRLIVKGDDTEFDAMKDADAVHAALAAKDSSVKIGVQNGTTGKMYCEGDDEAGFEKLPVTAVGYKNGSLACQDLINGNLNYVIIDSAPAKCITDALNKMSA
ncbi:MAG: transporter substrate-binding domain-containing protein [Eubacterium sp.]|nr:transporter substrate-binding domain-containing protein [Eubacterium sp.]